MNNLQLHTLACRCPFLKEVFIGVFPSDRIPDFRQLKNRRAYALIVNLDESQHAGSHWIAIYLPKHRNEWAEYFDSYGRPPTIPSFLKLLKKYKGYVFNNDILQSPYSTVCGQYCLFYLCHRAKKERIPSILRYFRNQSKYTNDILVNRYVRRYFRTNLKLCDIPFIGRQIAVSLLNLPILAL